ncbi:MAG: AraC family transcriptional regulator [Clostridia bacterium]|nr:AraC family transcriptional regulator [Clostridia bacterium]
MDWATGIQRAIDYIEAHIAEPLDYDEIARQAFSSGYHFQRVFGILCGWTLGEYIRNRRLSLAGEELQSDGVKVIDAAVKYGYDSPDSFARAFQKFHGVTPSQARGGATLRSFSRLRVKISLEGGMSMNYRIEQKPEMILTCFGRRFEGAPEARLAQEAEFTMRTRPQQYLLMGLDSFDNMPSSASVVMNVGDDGFDFFLGRFLSGEARENMASEYSLGPEYAALFRNMTIPAHTCAVFETDRCAYPTETFLDLRARIVSEWLPSSGYQLSNAPEVTVYHWYGGARRDSRFIELWMPIEERKAE